MAGSSIADQATVSGGRNPTGTVTFSLYGNPQGTGTPLFTDTEALAGGTAASAGTTVTAAGTYYWVATYNGDRNNNPVNSGTALEPVTITPATPTTVTVSSGSPQSTTVGLGFADPLVVMVEDTYGNPVPGVRVTFAAPTPGASATLAGAPATTSADGRASVTATANAIGGSYTVTASIDGATSATFHLTNIYQAVALFDQTKPNRSGSTVPITIKLTDAQGQNAGSSGLPVTAVSVLGPSGPVPLQSPGNSQPDNLFTFDPKTKTYQFNLETTGYKKGTYTLYFRIGNDTTLYSVSFRVS
jgi:adhesin/invasin